MVLRIDRGHESLIRIHDLSQKTENNLAQIAEMLVELGFIFEKRNFNVGIDPRLSKE